MKSQKSLYILLIASIVAISGITVAYAALSSSITVTSNKVTQSVLSWNVGFDTSQTITVTSGGTSSTGRSCGAATVTATSITIADTTLSKPDDMCVYPLKIKNSGTIGAKLESSTGTVPSGITCGTNTTSKMICGNITYTLSTDDKGVTPYAANSTIAASGTQTVYLVAKYTGTSVVSTAVNHTGAKFTLKYVQN